MDARGAIDLNADLGENSPGRVVADDAAMLEVVTSANVSCGAHAGHLDGIRATLEAARARGVAVGAHPGYRDAANFGRRELPLTPLELRDEVSAQLGVLHELARGASVVVRYVKPHGAMYHAIARDAALAASFAAAVRDADDGLILLVQPGSAAVAAARGAGLDVAFEAFADRAYLPDGTLAPRTLAGAVLHDPARVAERVARLVADGTIDTIDGRRVAVDAASVCVHGDSPGAVAMATAVRARLAVEGIAVRSFTSPAPASPRTPA